MGRFYGLGGGRNRGNQNAVLRFFVYATLVRRIAVDKEARCGN